MSNQKTKRRRPVNATVEDLRAMPLAARYDAVREVIESGGDVGDHECLDDVFRSLCTRKTWPKDREHPALVNYGRANRWNFRDDATSIKDMDLPPSLSATSPVALYRLLHVVEPARLVCASNGRDYYQGGVFRFYSPDRRYLCWVSFQKHEVELTFYCPSCDLFIPEKPAWPESLRAEPTTEEEAADWWTPVTGGWAKFLHVPENLAAFKAHRVAEDAYQKQGVIVPWSSGRMRCQRAAGQAWMRLVVAVANTPWDLYPGNNFRV